MTIQQALGLEPESPTLMRLEALWPLWAQADQRLRVTTFADLREFQRAGEGKQVHGLIAALASRATVEGLDDPDAALALAFMLIPGAVTLARGLREWIYQSRPEWANDIAGLDTLVASELWRTIREFPAHRLENVVGNVLSRTKYACRLQMGDRVQLHRTHSLWPETILLDDDEQLERLLYASSSEGPSITTARVREAVRDAVEAGSINLEDADLLFEVSERVGELGYNLVRGSGGLTSHQVAAQLAEAEGISESTMRRRIKRTIDAIRAQHDAVGDAA
jgi:hypothetical protein